MVFNSSCIIVRRLTVFSNWVTYLHYGELANATLKEIMTTKNLTYLVCPKLSISGKSVTAMLHVSPIFSPLHNVINGEQHDKHLCN